MLEMFAIMIPIIAFALFIVIAAIVFSPKLRSKMMSREIKATKNMLDNLKDDLTDMGVSMSSVAVDMQKKILDEKEDVIKENTRRQASIEGEGIEIKTRAFRDGLTKDTKYCKHCGELIDEDSKFCKKCGKEQ